MKMSSLTLQNIKDMIPLQLTGRYSSTDFPANAFNEISQHLEKYADTDYMTAEMIIPQENGITDYALNDRVRQPRGLYLIPTDLPLDANRHVVVTGDAQASYPDIHPDKANPIRFDQFGNTLRVYQTPSVEEPIHTEDRTIVDATGSTTQKIYDVGSSSPLEEDEQLRGKAIIITQANGNVDHLIIADNDDDNSYARVNGEMTDTPEAGTVYSIYNNFWIFEYAIYLPRLSALSDSINVPLDFEAVYKWGMFWKYYAQEGENKVEIDRYQNMFEKEAMRFTSDQNRFRSDNKITIPRAIPNMFPS